MPDHAPDQSSRPAADWVGDWSARRARLSPGKTGLVDATTGTEFTYRELDDRANRTARLLQEFGVDDGGRVATLSRNRPELVDLFFATGKTGGTLAPLSHRLAPPELAVLLTTVDPELVVVEEPFTDLLEAVLGHEACTVTPAILELSKTAVAGGDSSGTGSNTVSSPIDSYASALGADSSPVDRAAVTLDDTHLLLHTGGSTGVPKETIVPHRAVYWNSVNTITGWGLGPDDSTVMPFPMFHTGGWNVLTVPLFHVGGTVVIAREFDAGEVLRLVDTHDATLLVAVPAVLRMMVEHDDWATSDLSSLRLVKSGGGPCREGVMAEWWDRGIDLSQGYGLTECGPNNFAMPDDWRHEKADSVGVPNVHVDARIVDDDGTVLPAGEVGELELAGPHAAVGYLDNPGETEATFGDGWVSTGDLARVDADGYFHIEGRKKNMFVSGGENVYPPEVEDAIADHPAVADVVVIGVPDDQWGTVGKAVVEPAVGDDGSELTLDDLHAFLDGRLARFKVPRHLAFVDEMPKSGPSKIDRDAIREAHGGPD